MRTKTEWRASDLSGAKYMGVLEFQDEKGEWHDFEVKRTESRLVFGGSCNAVWLESGYIEREEGESLDETLAELMSDLQAHYNAGPEHVTRIVCNERM